MRKASKQPLITKRDVVAALITPLVAPMLSAVIWEMNEPGSVFSYGWMGILGFVTVVSYTAFVAFAIPVILTLRTLGIYSLATIAIAAFMTGYFVQGAVELRTGILYLVTTPQDYSKYLLGGFHGLAVGVVFYFLGGWRSTGTGRRTSV